MKNIILFTYITLFSLSSFALEIQGEKFGGETLSTAENGLISQFVERKELKTNELIKLESTLDNTRFLTIEKVEVNPELLLNSVRVMRSGGDGGGGGGG